MSVARAMCQIPRRRSGMILAPGVQGTRPDSAESASAKQGLWNCILTAHEKCKRHRGDSNPCGQTQMDFKTISLAARTQCHVRLGDSACLPASIAGAPVAKTCPPVRATPTVSQNPTREDTVLSRRRARKLVTYTLPFIFSRFPVVFHEYSLCVCVCVCK